jgi:lysophospholipase L1-like esterase
MKTPDNGSLFLFQGDSITDGGRGRTDDMNHILGHSYAYLISAKLGEKYAEKNWRFVNKGISGDRTVDLYARLEEDALVLEPDIISIMVGTNDVGEYFFDFSSKCGISAEKYERVYQAILDEIKHRKSGTTIVLCEPFVLPVGIVKEHWDKWWPEVEKRQQIVRNLAQKQNAIFVPLQNIFDKACKRQQPNYWIWDGIHPTPWGHSLIAGEWMKIVLAEEM